MGDCESKPISFSLWGEIVSYMLDRLQTLFDSQIVMYVGVVLILSGFLVSFVITPTITVQKVEYEGENSEVSEEVVYMSSLSESEQEAVREGKAVDSLGSYTYMGLSPTNRFIEIVGDDGVYSIYATADYGVWNPFIVHGQAIGAFLFSGGFIWTFLSAGRKSRNELTSEE